MMDHRSKRNLPVLPAVLPSVLVLAGGLLLGRDRSWGSAFDGVAADLGWLALGVAMVLGAVLAVRRAGRDMDAAGDDDAYYRRGHFGAD